MKFIFSSPKYVVWLSLKVSSTMVKENILEMSGYLWEGGT